LSINQLHPHPLLCFRIANNTTADLGSSGFFTGVPTVINRWRLTEASQPFYQKIRSRPNPL
jgi:hypothetical protein